MIRLFINNVEYPVEDGAIINEKYNEELDSAIVTIPYTNKLELSPFDFVKLQINDENKYFLINTWTDETVSFDPLKYSYNISLISETIKLQKIVCPNLAITQPIGLTSRTIAEKLQQYYDLYIHPQYPELTLSQDLLDLCNVSCPENMFSRPTMFEVFNTLLAKVNAVVKITNHSIGFLKLDEYGHEIDESKLYYDNDSQNINEYANRLDVNIDNAVSNTVNYSSVSGITIRADNEAVLNDDNMIIMLDKPIYDMSNVNVYMYFPIVDVDDWGHPDAVRIKRKVSISDYIVEKSVYDTLPSSNSTGVITGAYKRNRLYYVAGDNKIQGLSFSEGNFLGFSTKSAIENIVNNETPSGYTTDLGQNLRETLYFSVEYRTSESFRMNVIKDNNYNATLIDNQSEKQVDVTNFGKVEQDKLNRLGNKEKIITGTYYRSECLPKDQQVTDGNNIFKITDNHFYDPYNEFDPETGGFPAYTYYLTMEDGATVSVRDNLSNTFMVSNNQFTAHNKTFTFIQFADLPELSDYIGEYMLAQRELIIYDDYTLFKGYLYKNYVRKNLFYGLSSKKRFTQITDEFVNRDEIINYKLTFSDTEPEDTISWGYDDMSVPRNLEPTSSMNYIKRFILQPLNNYSYTGSVYKERLKYCQNKFIDNNNNYIHPDGIVLSVMSNYICGKSNVITYRMVDNFSAGIQVGAKASGGRLQKYVNYTDNYGEFKSVEYQLRSNKEEDFFDNGDISQSEGNYGDFDTYRDTANALPYMSDIDKGSLNSNYIISDSKLVYKDNSEVFGMTFNFNFKDTPNFIIGDIASYTGFSNDKATGLKFCYSNTETYEIGDTKGLGETTTMLINTYNSDMWYSYGILANDIVLTTGLNTWKSIGILDANDNLILGINKTNNMSSSQLHIYLNIEKESY